MGGDPDAFPLDSVRMDSLARAVVRRGAYIVPTLIVAHQYAAETRPSLAGVPLADRVPDHVHAFWARGDAAPPSFKHVFDLHERFAAHLTRRVAALGGRVGAGSDLPNPYVTPGGALHQELELLVGAGLTPLQAIRAATGGAADILGRAELGVLAAGKVADVIVVGGNPAADIAATRDVRIVIRNGRVLPMDALLAAAPPVRGSQPAAAAAEAAPVPDAGAAGAGPHRLRRRGGRGHHGGGYDDAGGGGRAAGVHRDLAHAGVLHGRAGGDVGAVDGAGLVRRGAGDGRQPRPRAAGLRRRPGDGDDEDAPRVRWRDGAGYAVRGRGVRVRHGAAGDRRAAAARRCRLDAPRLHHLCSRGDAVPHRSRRGGDGADRRRAGARLEGAGHGGRVRAASVDQRGGAAMAGGDGDRRVRHAERGAGAAFRDRRGGIPSWRCWGARSRAPHAARASWARSPSSTSW